MLLLAAWLLRAATALLVPSIYWPDEIYQVLEHGHRIVFGYGIQTWDWAFGLRSIVPPVLFTPFFFLAREFGLGPEIYMPAIGMALCAYSLIIVWVAFRMESDWRQSVLIAAPAAVWSEMVLFAPHALMDTLAAPLVVLGIYLLQRHVPKATLWAGAAFGLAACLRPALGPAMAIGALLSLRGDIRGWARFVAGGMMTVIPYGLADLSVGRAPFSTLLLYATTGTRIVATNDVVVANGENLSAEVAGQSWHYLFDVMMIHSGNLLPILFLLICAGARGNRVWIVVAVAIFATYSFVPQREYRYVYPALACLMIPMGFGLQRTVSVMARSGFAPPGTLARMAVAALLTCSLLTALGSGMRDEWLHGTVGIKALDDVRQSPALCGLAMTPDVPFIFLGGYTSLHRNIPVLDQLGDPAGRTSEYSDLLTGTTRSDLPPSYRLLKCHQGTHADWADAPTAICHYQRSGRCALPAMRMPSKP